MDNINTTALGRREQNINDAISALEGDTSFSLRQRLVALRGIHKSLTKRITVLEETVTAQDEDAEKQKQEKGKDKE